MNSSNDTDVMLKGKQRRKKRRHALIKHRVFRARNILPLASFILSLIYLISVLGLSFLSILKTTSLFIALLIGTILGSILINVHKKKPLKGVGYIFLITTLVVNIACIYRITETNKFTNAIFKNENRYFQTTYYVLSKQDSTDIEENEKIGVYKYTSSKEEALDKLASKYENTVVEYETIDELLKAFTEKSVENILMDEKLYNEIIDVKYNYDKRLFKTMYEYSTYEKNIDSDVKNEEKFNVLVEIVNENGITKYDILLTVNLNNMKIVSTSIPANTYLEVPGTKTRDTLGNMILYGADKANQSIEKLLNIDIEYNIKITEKELISLAKRLGIKYNSNVIEEEVSIKHIMENNDLTELAKKTFEKILLEKNPISYSEYLNLLSSSYETNISKKIAYTIFKELINKKEIEIEKVRIKGETKLEKVYSSNINNVVSIVDNSSVIDAEKTIKEALN